MAKQRSRGAILAYVLLFAFLAAMALCFNFALSNYEMSAILLSHLAPEQQKVIVQEANRPGLDLEIMLFKACGCDLDTYFYLRTGIVIALWALVLGITLHFFRRHRIDAKKYHALVGEAKKLIK